MREMRIVLAVFLLSFICCVLYGVAPVKVINRENLIFEIDKLNNQFGQRKTVPDDLKAEFYAAIKYYPEFRDVKIIVRRKNIKTTMQCRPRLDFFLHRKKNRTYIIYVDNKKEKENGVLFEELPCNARVGVFGHELAHISDYNSKNFLSILAMGIMYLNSNMRKIIEHHVDNIAISKGLGYQINDFSKYVFEESAASIEYINYKKRFYFQPQQINNIIAQTPLYFGVE